VSPPLNVNLSNEYGYSALHVACRHHDMDLIRLLLARGANKNKLAALSGGPLHMAVTVNGAVDVVRVLIKAGADPHLRNNQHGRTPLHVAVCDECRPWDATKGALRPLKPLLLTLLDLQVGHWSNKDGRESTQVPSPCVLRTSRQSNVPRFTCISLLIHASPNHRHHPFPQGHANDVDREGRTPLALCVLRAKRLCTLKLLLEHREVSKTYVESRSEKDPFGLVPDSARTGPYSSDCELGDKQGHTPLWHAIEIGRMELVEALLDANDRILREGAAEWLGEEAGAVLLRQ